MRGLPIKYCRHAIEKTEAVANEPSTLIFKSRVVFDNLLSILIDNSHYLIEFSKLLPSF